MKLDAIVGLAGKFEFIVRDTNGEIKQHYAQKNRILNVGLDLMASRTSVLNTPVDTYCGVGTGTAPVLDTDTQLQTFLAMRYRSGTTLRANWGFKPYYVGTQTTYVFPAGTINTTITECCVSPGTLPGSVLFNRVVLDTPITVLPTDELTVIFSLYYSIPEDYTINVNDGTTNYTVTVHPTTVGYAANSSGFKWVINERSDNHYVNGQGPACKTDPTQTPYTGTFPGQSNTSNLAAVSYVPGSYKGVCEYVWLADKGNHVGGIGSLFYAFSNYQGTWQFIFNPKLPKTAEKVLRVRLGMQFARASVPSFTPGPFTDEINFASGEIPPPLNPNAGAANWYVTTERPDGVAYTNTLRHPSLPASSQTSFTFQLDLAPAGPNPTDYNFAIKVSWSIYTADSFWLVVDGVTYSTVAPDTAYSGTNYFWWAFKLPSGVKTIQIVSRRTSTSYGQNCTYFSRILYNKTP